MNTNEEVASRNKDRVYNQANNFLKVNGTTPKQADIIALCPGMNRKTVCKYFKQWLAENQLDHSEVEEIEVSEVCLKSFQNEIRRHRIKAHQEMFDRNKELENANEVLGSERDDQAKKLQLSQIEIGELRKNLGYYQGQFESQGEEIKRLLTSLQSAGSLGQHHQKSADEAIQGERETARKLAEALSREQQLRSELEVLKQSKFSSERLLAALQRERWFEETGRLQFEINQQRAAISSVMAPKRIEIYRQPGTRARVLGRLNQQSETSNRKL